METRSKNEKLNKTIHFCYLYISCLDMEPHDRYIDIIITEERIIYEI